MAERYADGHVRGRGNAARADRSRVRHGAAERRWRVHLRGGAEAARIDAELASLNAFRHTPVRQIALRATGLSAKTIATIGTIADMVERVRELEGLPESDSQP
jgi:hypothetical protein